MASLSPTVETFVLHWGEMGTRWGINRSVAQAHALLLVSGESLTAEDISETLSMARSTVSTALKELQSWGLIRVVHELGDRRDHFEAVGDVWDMAMLVASGRKRREIDPTIEVLRACVAEPADTDAYAQARLKELLDFVEAATGFFDQLQRMPKGAARELFLKGGTWAGVVARVGGRGGDA